MENGTTIVRNGTADWVCERWMGSNSMGIWHGHDPTRFSTTLLLLQISAVSSFSALLDVVLRPLGHTFVSQMLAGIFLGPSVLGHSKALISKLFHIRSLYLIESLEALCFMFISYFTTAQVDLEFIKKGGRLAIINGFLLFMLPVLASYATVSIIVDHIGSSIAESTSTQIFVVGRTEGSMFFQVAYEVLSNLEMLNSEPGRLALSSAMACNCFNWIFFIILLTYRRSLRSTITTSIFWPIASKLLLIMAIVVVCRPILQRIMKETPEGQNLKPSHLCIITIMLCTCAFLAECVGFSFMVGSVVMGLVTPKQPPLGQGLTNKMGSFVSVVLVPCYVIGIGNKVDIYAIKLKDFFILESLHLVIMATKFVSVVVPSLYFNVPFSHTVIIGLIVSIQGIYDVQLYKQALNYKTITDQAFGIMVVSAMIHSTILTTILKHLYCSRHKHIAYRRRTVQHCQPETPIRILTCFSNHTSVPSVLNILELLCPSRRFPLSVFALNLEELEIHTVPQLIHHKVDKNSSLTSSNHRGQIVNAFLHYLQLNQVGLMLNMLVLHRQENVSVDTYTAVAPRKTMHEDVFAMAFNKETNLMLLALDLEAEMPSRWLCRNVLANSLCSIAILVDRGRLPNLRSAVTRHMRVKVCAIFLGGDDDRETLALAAQMANHPSVDLEVLRLVDQENLGPLNNMIERKLDIKAINRFREETREKENVVFREERVKDGSNVVDTLRKEGNNYQLIMVGIRHEEGLKVLQGLSVWSEMRELGEIGDLLVSKDLGLTASVLAVQQQHLVAEGMLHR